MHHGSASTHWLLLATLATIPAQAQFDLQNSHTTASLRGIHSLGNGIAWASGTDGAVRRTADGGTRWQTCAIPPGAEHLDFRGIQAFDENTAIVMSSGKGDLSRLYKTTDGCRTWTLLFTNPDKEGFWDAIQFSSPDRGVLLGDPVNSIFVVMLTFNGGLKWERQTLRATQDINGEGAFAASNSSLLLESGLGSRTFCTGGPGGPRVIALGAGRSDTPSSSVEGSLWPADLHAERLPVKGRAFEGSGASRWLVTGVGRVLRLQLAGTTRRRATKRTLLGRRQIGWLLSRQITPPSGTPLKPHPTATAPP